MSLLWQTLGATETINTRTIEAWTMTTAAPDTTIMAIRGTTILLTNPVLLLTKPILLLTKPVLLLTKQVLLLRVTVSVVIFQVVKTTHLGRTGRARLSLPPTPVLSKEEPVGALGVIEGAREEHTDKDHMASLITLEVTTASAD